MGCNAHGPCGDATTGAPLHTLTDRIGEVTAVAFSPDGRLLATATAVGMAWLRH